jgi:hypothetical protein
MLRFTVISNSHLEYMMARQKHEEQHGGASHQPQLANHAVSETDSTGKEKVNEHLSEV